MQSFIERSINAGRKFNVLDFAVFKICLMCLGIIAGMYFAQFFLGLAALLWVIFIVSWVFIMYRTFVKYWQ